TEISISSSAISSPSNRENRGSSVAAAAAQCATTSASDSIGDSCPMHPQSRRCLRSVTNAPLGTAKAPCSEATSSGCRSLTISAIAFRAISSRVCFSSLRSGLPSGHILRVFFPFQNDLDALPLFDAIVDLIPEHQEVMHGGHNRADHHQPEQYHRQQMERRMRRRKNDNAAGQHLQH